METAAATYDWAVCVCVWVFADVCTGVIWCESFKFHAKLGRFVCGSIATPTLNTFCPAHFQLASPNLVLVGTVLCIMWFLCHTQMVLGDALHRSGHLHSGYLLICHCQHDPGGVGGCMEFQFKWCWSILMWPKLKFITYIQIMPVTVAPPNKSRAPRWDYCQVQILGKLCVPSWHIMAYHADRDSTGTFLPNPQRYLQGGPKRGQVHAFARFWRHLPAEFPMSNKTYDGNIRKPWCSCMLLHALVFIWCDLWFLEFAGKTGRFKDANGSKVRSVNLFTCRLSPTIQNGRRNRLFFACCPRLDWLKKTLAGFPVPACSGMGDLGLARLGCQQNGNQIQKQKTEREI